MVPGFNTGRAEVLDDDGNLLRTIPVKNGQFTDKFGKCDIHIYRITDEEV
jgi:hypothetical protein